MSKIVVAAKELGMGDHVLAFSTSRVLKGFNLTFRNGSKYAEIMNPGDTVLLVDTAGTAFNNGRIIGTEVFNIKKWKHQIKFLLQFNHDQSIDDFEKLMIVFDKCYGKNHWGPSMTAVYFWIEDVDPYNHSSHSEKHIVEKAKPEKEYETANRKTDEFILKQ